ncbi:zinc carboxypeptidase-like [Neodiprion fabricii]|uniref:zinc carboxypeptidase-like n=1 Tax=Neodiprion fabricii TaxID=2872261 RepID=UPI001ED8EC21|nr:zinc carboxypeptidase-like [Neodiprion fabricii]
MLRLWIIAACAATAVFAGVDRFDNYKVFAVTPNTTAHLNLLRELGETENGFDLWNNPARLDAPVHIMVPPHRLYEFEEYMNVVGAHYTTYIEDVQKLIDAENGPLQSRDGSFGWTSYHTLNEIYEWLESLAVKYPENVEVVVAGSTYEDREIKGIKISFGSDNPGIFIEGGIHAREWISPATVTYITNELLTSTDPDVRELADRHDWYIFPVFNPDGYAHTHSSSRLWRKTRSRVSALCRGADPNRNWGFQWNTGGASSLPCVDTYAGSGPFSEIETKSASEYIDSISDKFYAYISFHSYTQLLLIPYGHTTDHLDNYDELYEIGIITAEALQQRYGTTYTVGNIAETIYVATGASVDWVKATYNTPITYIYELRDLGQWGFLLPAAQIIPTGEETLDSLVAMFKAAKARGHGV